MNYNLHLQASPRDNLTFLNKKVNRFVLVQKLNKLGYVHLNEPVTVHTAGGDLIVEIAEEGAYLQGPAEAVYVGVVEGPKSSTRTKKRRL